ncbi:putative endo-1,3(4)-beta-glucanase [Lophiotrema nucula]|uniref:endo-1,3(4)-beta-glucanase n=1 Tax=Lophiotrema nucula TaxID=690887 RepID=A0A6A5ZFK9_9PLEO|nr:putative endo-1,3(4)-beta-glucanase [Lophiotrema nucula]
MLRAALCYPYNVSSAAAYALVDNYSGSSLLSSFNFFTDRDPTNGHVKYLSQADAQNQGLVKIDGTSVYLGVDHTNKAPGGRPSVRLQSKKTYNRGLFILDLAHMPSSTCGTWPSFWTWGDSKLWPINGEIDIIEGVHTNNVNAMSLHTANGCTISGSSSLGRVVTKDCYVQATGQTSNAGCGIESSSGTSFGTPFNSAGGGVYAMEWTSSAIRMWYWPRASVPADLSSPSPNPANWGNPQANFAGGSCDYNNHFIDHRIIVDTTFCGDWAGATWASNPSCTALSNSCTDYVANNPAAFAESYWKINSLKVFRQ